MATLTKKEQETLKGDSVIISEELDNLKTKYADKLLNGFGETMLNNLDKPVTLNKTEKKILKQQRKDNFLKKITKFLLGDTDDTTY